MVKYNPKEWFSLILAFHKSDTFRQLLLGMLTIAAYAALVAFLEIEVWEQVIGNDNIIHKLIGFVISLLLVFRTNTAYQRWWEGRIRWGMMVNNTRNLAIKLSTFIPKEEQMLRQDFVVLIGNYVKALKEHLRDNPDTSFFEESEGFKKEELEGKEHYPNYIALKLLAKIKYLYDHKIIDGYQWYILNAEYQSLTDITGACERIKNTPIPYTYSIFLKKFIFVYIMLLPFGLIEEFEYGIIPIVVFVFYVLTSMEIIAEEIEEPFGEDANDLPVDDLCVKIRNNIQESMDN